MRATLRRGLCTASQLSHVDGALPKMVDVGAKGETRRSAIAEVAVRFPPDIYAGIFGVRLSPKPNPNPKPSPNLDSRPSLGRNPDPSPNPTPNPDPKEGQALEAAAGPKGPILATSTIAAVQAAKKTSDLIPFCHPLPLERCDVQYERLSPDPNPGVRIQVTAACSGKTGVEMEALTAASVAALTIYDMCKAVTHDMHIT
mmetsp:Transcript_21275/g.64781  ORF Transcript_21275/g.64781 Transcript_21275/m.64781 type:complete len:200 (-) Transcript_21275:121-720(-)